MKLLKKKKSGRNVANKFEGILVFHTYNRETKAVHAERFIQTLKQMIRRTLTTLDLGHRYISYLPLIVERYKRSVRTWQKAK